MNAPELTDAARLDFLSTHADGLYLLDQDDNHRFSVHLSGLDYDRPEFYAVPTTDLTLRQAIDTVALIATQPELALKGERCAKCNDPFGTGEFAQSRQDHAICHWCATNANDDEG